MRKTYKLMIIDNISLIVDDTCQAKDISRVRMKIFQNGDESKSYTTSAYAQISENQLYWKQPFEFRYTGQQKLTFQTYCEHQYGYKLQQLQVLYKGIYFIKNQMFFRPDSCHIYSPQGQKKGLLRWQIKVVNRQQPQFMQQKQQIVKPLVREDLIGLIKIHEAKFEICNPIFNKNKYKHLELKISFPPQSCTFNQSFDLAWKLNELKLQYVKQGSKSIDFQILFEGKEFLDGSTSCQNIQKLKRYIKHKVSMFNKNGIKIGFLVLQYRYVEKQQLLNLLYSSNFKINVVQRSKSTQNLEEDLVKVKPLNMSVSKLPKKHHVSFFNESENHNQTNRYKIAYLMNHNSNILIPKSTRFPDQKPNSPFISYIDPEKSSDFLPKSHKGWDISRGNKFDFTRQYRGNPGVGSYKLPSIWSKY